MKIAVCLAGVLVLGGLLPPSANAQAQGQSQFGLSGVRLAVFSPQRAFAESAEGKAGIATLSALQEKRKREMDERNKALQAQEDALKRSLGVLNEDSKSQRSKQLEKLRLDTQRFIEDAHAELMGVQRDIENAFALKLQPALEQVVKSQGIQLVFNLDGGTLIRFEPSLDITAEVVKHVALK
jgi:Skp family chaperone for outer membrane proteins